MHMGLSILWITALAGIGGTGLGGLVGALFPRDSNRTVSLLLSFAAGVMLSVVCFDLVPGAISPQNAAADMPIATVAAGVAAGFLIIFALNYVIDRNTNHEVRHIGKDHPRTADDLDELTHIDHLVEHEKQNDSRTELFWAGVVMAAAIALHNLPEGMVIGASFAEGGPASLSRGGFLIATVIGLHNIPEGIAVAVPVYYGSGSRAKGVAWSALSGLSEPLGALLAFMLLAPFMSAVTLGIIFAAVAGIMIFISFDGLIPSSQLYGHTGCAIGGAAAGIVFMKLAMTIFGL